MPGEETLHLEIDPTELTLGEMEEVERYVGRPFSEIAEDLEAKKAPIAVVTALVYLAGRRKDPNYTWEQAKATKVQTVIEAAEAAPAAPDDPKAT